MKVSPPPPPPPLTMCAHHPLPLTMCSWYRIHWCFFTQPTSPFHASRILQQSLYARKPLLIGTTSNEAATMLITFAGSYFPFRLGKRSGGGRFWKPFLYFFPWTCRELSEEEMTMTYEDYAEMMGALFNIMLSFPQVRNYWNRGSKIYFIFIRNRRWRLRPLSMLASTRARPLSSGPPCRHSRTRRSTARWRRSPGQCPRRGKTYTGNAHFPNTFSRMDQLLVGHVSSYDGASNPGRCS